MRSPSVRGERTTYDFWSRSALDLRNRVFWASDELAKEIREGGRYAFRGEPLIASKFVSRYRVNQTRRSRRKKSTAAASPPAP